MDDDDIDLPALMGSRICHDLVSPLGAIGNGVELLAMAGGTQSAELSLISQAVDNANARLRFFRVAFGAAKAGQNMAAREVTNIIEEFSSGGKIGVEWQVAGDVARREAKIAFLLIQCLETAMPYGGQIVVSSNADTWTLNAASDRFRDIAELWAVATEGVRATEMAAAHIQFPLVWRELGQQGRKLGIVNANGQITLKF